MLELLRSIPFVTLLLCQALSMSLPIILISIGGNLGLELSGGIELATLPISASVVGTFFFLYPASYLSSIKGRKATFMVGGMVGMVGSAICFIALKHALFWLFCGGTFLLGAQIATAQYYRFAAAELVEERLKAQALSLALSGGILAALLGPTIARTTVNLLPQRYGATIVSLWVLCFAITLLMAAFFRTRESETTQLEAKSQSQPSWPSDPIRKVGLAAAICSCAIGYGIMVLLMNAAPVTMQHHHGLSFHQAVSVVQWHVFAMYIPSLFTGKIISFFGVHRVILAGVAILATVPLAATAGYEFHHFAIGLVLLGLGWNFTFVGGSVLLTRNTLPQRQAFIQGTNDSVVFLCNVSGSFLAGLTLSFMPWVVLNWISVPLIAIIASLTLWHAARLRAETPHTALRYPSP